MDYFQESALPKTVVYTSDDGYVMLLAVSLLSLLETNDNNHIWIYVISNGISQENKKYLSDIVSNYKSDLTILEMPDLDKLCGVELETYQWARNTKATYMRLFLTEIMPPECQSVLWLDCDTLICGNIKELFEIDLSNYACMMVRENNDLAALANRVTGAYFNGGVMLINLKDWRTTHFSEKVIHELKRRKGRGPDKDQSLINYILNKRIGILPPEYNFQPAFYRAVENYEDYIKVFYPHKNKEAVYTEDELRNAEKNKKIIHFMGYGNWRPWYSNCCHPDKEKWIEYLYKTKFRNYKMSSIQPDTLFGNKRRMDIRRWVMKIPFINSLILKVRFGIWIKNIEK